MARTDRCPRCEGTGNETSQLGAIELGEITHAPCTRCQGYGVIERTDEQPMPTASDSPSMHDLVCDDMRKRKELGLSRYGRALQANNGRDALRDVYEEILDAAAYMRQMLYERDGK